MVSLDSLMHGLTFSSSFVLKHMIRCDCATFRVRFLKARLDFLVEAEDCTPCGRRYKSEKHSLNALQDVFSG